MFDYLYIALIMNIYLNFADDLQVNKSFQKSYKPRKKQLTKKQQVIYRNVT